MDKKIHHPNEDCLRSFALGALDEATASFIRQHLEICDHCAHSMEKSVAACNPILAQEPLRAPAPGEVPAWAPSWAPAWAMNQVWQKGAAKGLWPATPSQSSADAGSAPESLPSQAPTASSAQPSPDAALPAFDSQPKSTSKKNSEPVFPQVPDWATQIPLAKDGSSVSLQSLSPALLEQNQYRIVRRLGEGSLGTVYLAQNLLFDREEALKVVPLDKIKELGVCERFLAEMDAASRFNHPHIAASHGAMKWDEFLVFCMEYVPGENLASYVARYVKEKGLFPVANACYYGYQTALGLQHAHENGMFHRDIKPSNLMLFRNGHRHIVKILDFGLGLLAKEYAVSGSGAAGEPKTTANLGPSRAAFAHPSTIPFPRPGTVHYLAPEQTAGGGNGSVQADIYSLGCTLYHLLCGHPPFEGHSNEEVLRKHAATQAPRIDDLRPEVPYPVGSILRRMMAKDPAKRYESLAEVAQALTPFFKPDPPSKKMDAVVAASTQLDEERRPGGTGGEDQPDRVVKTKSRRKSARRCVHRGRFQVVAVTGMVLTLALAMGAIGVATPRFAGWLRAPAEPKFGIVAIEGVPPGAVFHVDGVHVNFDRRDGKVEIAVDAGKDHLLEIKKEGFETWSYRIAVGEGSKKSVKALLPLTSRMSEKSNFGLDSKGMANTNLGVETLPSKSSKNSLLPDQGEFGQNGSYRPKRSKEAQVDEDPGRAIRPKAVGPPGKLTIHVLPPILAAP